MCKIIGICRVVSLRHVSGCQWEHTKGSGLKPGEEELGVLLQGMCRPERKWGGLCKADWDSSCMSSWKTVPFTPMFLLLGELQVSCLNPMKPIFVLLLFTCLLTDVEYGNQLDFYLQDQLLNKQHTLGKIRIEIVEWRHLTSLSTPHSAKKKIAESDDFQYLRFSYFLLLLPKPAWVNAGYI